MGSARAIRQALAALIALPVAFTQFASQRLRAQTYRFTTVVAASPGESNSALAVDGSGNLYVADETLHTIRKISPAGAKTTLAGLAGQRGANDGKGPDARFWFPRGIAVDASGTLYVSDTGNDLIRKVTSEGEVTTLAGIPRQPNDLGGPPNDGPARAARFHSPIGIAVDSAGTVYVAENGRRTIRKISVDGMVSTLAGSDSLPIGAIDGVGQNARFDDLRALSVDSAGNLFVADYMSTLRKVSRAGVVTTLAGADDEIGSNDGAGVTARFNGVKGIALGADGTLFVTDAGNATLRALSPDGVVTTIAGQVAQRDSVDGVGGFARFRAPYWVTTDAAGNLWIADGEIRKGTPMNAPAPPILHTQPAGGFRTVGANTRTALTIGVSGTPPFAFQWTKNGFPIAGATDATLQISGVNIGDEGGYAATVSNAGGAVTSNLVRLRVYAPRLTSFTPRHAKTGGSFLWGIAAGAGRLVAVGTEGTILTSIDGRAWLPAVSGTREWLVGVTFAASRFIAVGDHGVILSSADGLTWRPARDSGTSARLNNVIYAQEKFVAVGEGGAIVTSADGETWTPRVSGVNTWLRGLVYRPPDPPSTNQYPAYTEPRFYATGAGGVRVTSGNAEEWHAGHWPSPHAATDFEALLDGPIAIGADGAVARESFRSYPTTIYGKSPPYTDYTYYTLYSFFSSSSIGIAARFRGVVRGAGAIFATGENGVIAAAANENGPWAVVPSGTTANLVNGVFRGETLYIVGENETILESDPLFVSRLTNISTRGSVGPDALISGFVVTGEKPKQMLVRAAGPALAGFGLSGTLAETSLVVMNAAGQPLATNEGWSAAPNASAIGTTAARLGAFPFSPGSADSALLLTLAPGNYTAHVTGRNGATGVALVEAYDADALSNEGSRAINISTRGTVSAGQPMIAGFFLAGADARRVLIRAVGPSLGLFGLNGVLPKPRITLHDSSGAILRETVGAWSVESNAAEISAAAELAGAFPLAEDAADAALVVTLLPGSYTAQVAGLNATAGTALVEVYELP